MEVINRKGFTALVDAMIFIALMTMALTVIYTLPSIEDGPEPQNASEMLDILLESETVADIGDGPITMKIYQGLVYSFYTECGTDDEVSNILESHFMRENSYLLTVKQGDKSYSLGSGGGIPTSACTRILTTPYFTAAYTLEIF